MPADTVSISESEENAMRETQYLNSIPGMAESISEGMNTPVEECITEDKVKFAEVQREASASNLPVHENQARR